MSNAGLDTLNVKKQDFWVNPKTRQLISGIEKYGLLLSNRNLNPIKDYSDSSSDQQQEKHLQKNLVQQYKDKAVLHNQSIMSYHFKPQKNNTLVRFETFDSESSDLPSEYENTRFNKAVISATTNYQSKVIPSKKEYHMTLDKIYKKKEKKKPQMFIQERIFTTESSENFSTIGNSGIIYMR